MFGLQQSGKEGGPARRFLQTFRRAPRHSHSDSISSSAAHVDGFNERRAIARTAKTGLARELKPRHLQMIAFGGSIGAGLWVGTGETLMYAGPGALVLAYVVTGLILYITMQSLGELVATFPVAGSLASYGSRFIDPAWGFAMGWNYVMQWLVVIPMELIVALKTIKFWQASLSWLPDYVAVTIFIVLVFGVNLCGVRAYGEAEFVTSMIKIAAVVGFIILGIIVDIIGNQTSDFIGIHRWQDPGPFRNGFQGLCGALINAAFAFGGTELVGVAAAETKNPTRVLPAACKQIFWRIFFIYVGSILLVGLVVKADDPRLTSSLTSPFVIAIQDTGIRNLDGVMNAAILISVLSVANSSFFGSSRVLFALAEQGQAPNVLGYVDRKGRPLVAVVIGLAFSLLGFVGTGKAGRSLLEWLVALLGLSALITWATICYAHIRFRKAWAFRGHSLSELVYESPFGTIGSWMSIVGIFMILALQIYVAVIPQQGALTAGQRVTSLFQDVLAILVVLIFYIVFKVVYKTRWVSIDRIDVDTGRWRMKVPRNREDRSEWSLWKRAWHTFF